MKVHLVDGTYELVRAFYEPGGPSGRSPENSITFFHSNKNYRVR
ncbi:MAG: hypothetical protein OEU36_20235 [Gammaproteobacteria bacterium]|nr:hypothetical protein [Gammaproteobacteria bacterium]